jgi:RNA polymerase sigma-70 factor, ECF subfamily
MARAYEADPSRRQDLLQEVHVAIWRSLLTCDGRCSLRTWVYRVAHYTATKHTLESEPKP